MKNKYLNLLKNNQFTVAVDQINNSQALLPYILYKKMEAHAKYATFPYQEHITSKPTLTKLNILKNAFLNDKLQLKSHIKKLNENELELSVEVFKELNDSKDVICNALFNFTLSGLNINMAS